MNLFRFRRYDILVSLGCMALLSSFAWYANKGPRGFAYGETLKQQLADLASTNVALADEQAALEKRVRLLRPEHVDRDMLEELARRDLRMVYPNELIVRAQK